MRKKNIGLLPPIPETKIGNGITIFNESAFRLVVLRFTDFLLKFLISKYSLTEKVMLFGGVELHIYFSYCF
jgi:hypothetical protein